MNDIIEDAKLLPCPMCGSDKGYSLSEGSTYRWWNVVCNGCGRTVDECASDRRMTAKTELPKRWKDADETWNDAAEYAHELTLDSKGEAVVQEPHLPLTTVKDHNDGNNLKWCVGCSPNNCSGCGNPDMVAEVTHDGWAGTGVKWIIKDDDPDVACLPVGTKLYTTPPDLQAKLDKAIDALKRIVGYDINCSAIALQTLKDISHE
jgi:ferredoxin